MKMKTTRQVTRVIGGRLIFGIDEGRIEPFLTQRGFRDVRNTDTEELKRIYFTGPNAGRVMSTGAAIQGLFSNLLQIFITYDYGENKWEVS